MSEFEGKISRMSKRIATEIEKFEVGLKSSEAENKTASREMSFALKKATLKVLTRHEKDLSENAQMFDTGISSLRVLTDIDDHSSSIIEQ